MLQITPKARYALERDTETLLLSLTLKTHKQLTVAANDGSSLPQTDPKSAICRRIPPFIVVLTAGRIIRLRECADAILARHCDAIQVAVNFRTLMRDLKVLERHRDLFPNIGIFTSLFDTVRKLYRRCRHLVKLRMHVTEIEMQTDDILHDRLKQTRPSFVDKTDILGPRPLIVFKYPWYQFLYNDSPGLGELFRNPWQHDWYAAGQLVPSGGIKILESWDIEWRSIWHHLDLVSIWNPANLDRQLTLNSVRFLQANHSATFP